MRLSVCQTVRSSVQHTHRKKLERSALLLTLPILCVYPLVQLMTKDNTSSVAREKQKEEYIIRRNLFYIRPIKNKENKEKGKIKED